ncbi:MAG: carboxypeptidase regulatory-like domain-containing protein [Planctomycetes bacterium]|nr:carboxypeptidase regulatory-like domain-containing protein [Planctomycetota bacterium]
MWFCVIGGAVVVVAAAVLMFRGGPRVDEIAPPTTTAVTREQPADDAFSVAQELDEDDVDDAPRRALTPTTTARETRRRKVLGATIRADSKLPVRCTFRAYDAADGECAIVRAQNDSMLFNLSVDDDATKLVVQAADAFDLDPVTLPLARGDVTALRIEMPLAKGVVTGLVLDDSGAGVEGVRVRLDYGRAVRSTRHDGRFTFAPVRDDTYAVDLEREAFSSLSADVVRDVAVLQGAQVSPLTFTVRRGSTLRVRVLDAESEDPIEGVAVGVAVVGATGGGGRNARRSIPTDAQGYAEIRHLVAGAYDATARPAQAGLSRATARIDDLAEFEVREIELRITHGAGDVVGTVESQGGAPQPFARLIAEPEAGSSGSRSEARANSAGMFAFSGLPPGRYRVVAEPSYCRTYNWMPSATDVIDIVSGEVVNTRVVLRAGARVNGVVLSKSRRDTLVARLALPGQTLECPIADGRFSFGGLDAGFYRVEVVDPSNGAGAVLYSNGVQLTASIAHDVRIELP